MAMMGFDGYGMSPWMWAVMGTLMIVPLAGLSVLIVWAVRTIGGQRPVSSDSPLDVLNRRLAAGEITPEEFEKTRRHLQG
jgi:putative membrane protein